eukprot:gene19722-21668_t
MSMTFGNALKLTSRKKRPWCTRKKRCVSALSSHGYELEHVRKPVSEEIIQDADSGDSDTTSSSDSNVLKKFCIIQRKTLMCNGDCIWVYECSFNQTHTTFINGLSFKINESKEIIVWSMSMDILCHTLHKCGAKSVSLIGKGKKKPITGTFTVTKSAHRERCESETTDFLPNDCSENYESPAVVFSDLVICSPKEYLLP